MKIFTVIALIVSIGNVGCRSTAKNIDEQESAVKQDFPLGEKICKVSFSNPSIQKINFFAVHAREELSKFLLELESRWVGNPLAIDLMDNYTNCSGAPMVLEDHQISDLLTEVDSSSPSITESLDIVISNLRTSCSAVPKKPDPISVHTASSAPTLGTFLITFKTEVYKCRTPGIQTLRPCISGTADFYDYFDFNPANRPLVAELLTTAGRLIPGTPFVVEGKDIPFKYEGEVLTLPNEGTPCQ